MDLDELRRRVTSADAHTRRMAVHGAEDLLDLKVVSVLIPLAQRDPDEGVRKLAEHALRRMHAKLEGALHSLHQLPGFAPRHAEKPKEEPEGDLQSTDAAERRRAVQRLAAGKLRSQTGALVAMLPDEPEGWVRSEVAWALGLLAKKGEAREALCALLTDPVSRVRANAIEALHRLGEPDLDPWALPLLEDRDRRVRSNAALALAPTRWEDAKKTLAALAKSLDRLDRQAALYVAGELSPGPRIELLRKLEEDADPNIRERARRLIKTTSPA